MITWEETDADKASEMGRGVEGGWWNSLGGVSDQLAQHPSTLSLHSVYPSPPHMQEKNSTQDTVYGAGERLNAYLTEIDGLKLDIRFVLSLLEPEPLPRQIQLAVTTDTSSCKLGGLSGREGRLVWAR